MNTENPDPKPADSTAVEVVLAIIAGVAIVILVAALFHHPFRARHFIGFVDSRALVTHVTIVRDYARAAWIR